MDDQSQFEIQGETGSAEMVSNEVDRKNTELKIKSLCFHNPAKQQVVTE